MPRVQILTQPARGLLDQTDPRMLVCVLAVGAFCAAAALALAWLLRTARDPHALITQSRAAGIGAMLLLIYAVGECAAEGLTPENVTAVTLPIAFLGIAGLTRARCEELIPPAVDAAGAVAFQAAAPARASENRRAA